MRAIDTRLRVLRSAPPAEAPLALPSGEELGVALAILGISSVPLVSTWAGLGHWDATSLGLGALGVMFAAHELVGGLRAALRRVRR